MSNNFFRMSRRQLVALVGSSALLGIATRLLPTAAQTTAPAASDTAIDVLLEDHQKIKALMNQIAQTSDGNPSQRTHLLQQLAELFTVHNSTEENLIYPAI